MTQEHVRWRFNRRKQEGTMRLEGSHVSKGSKCQQREQELEASRYRKPLQVLSRVVT